MNIIRDPRHLWRYLAGIARGKEIPLVAAGGTTNHVHLLLDLPTTMPIAHALQHLKGSSAHWLNSHETPFAWQQGYGAFAIGQSQRETVLAYIANQEEHHKEYSFEQELSRCYGNTAFNTTASLFLGRVPCLRHSGQNIRTCTPP